MIAYVILGHDKSVVDVVIGSDDRAFDDRGHRISSMIERCNAMGFAVVERNTTSLREVPEMLRIHERDFAELEDVSSAAPGGA